MNEEKKPERECGNCGGYYTIEGKENPTCNTTDRPHTDCISKNYALHLTLPQSQTAEEFKAEIMKEFDTQFDTWVHPQITIMVKVFLESAITRSIEFGERGKK